MKKRPYNLLVFDLQGTLVDHGHFLAGSIDLLKRLKQEGYLVAAATNWGHQGLHRILQDLPADFTFDTTRNASISHSKPHPQMLFEILDELVVEPADALMIGDTVSDMQFGHNAGVDVLAISHDGYSEELLLSCQPLACLGSIKALKDWFNV